MSIRACPIKESAMSSRPWRVAAALLAFQAFASAAAACPCLVAPQRSGSAGDDEILDMAAVDADHYVVVGYENGVLGVLDWPVGDSLAFVELRRNDGRLEWRQVLDSPSTDIADAVAVGADGSIAVAGRTAGALFGGTQRGGMDGFLVVYDAQSTRLGFAQFGDERLQHPTAVAVMQDQIAVVGYDEVHIVGRAVEDWENATVTRFEKPRQGALAFKSHWRSPLAAPDKFTDAAATPDDRLLVLDRIEAGQGGVFVREWGAADEELRNFMISRAAALDFATQITARQDEAIVVGASATGLGGMGRGHSEGFVLSLGMEGGRFTYRWITQVPSEHPVWGGAAYVADDEVVYVTPASHIDDLELLEPRNQWVIARLDRDGRLAEVQNTPMSNAYGLGFDIDVLPLSSAAGTSILLGTSVTGDLPGTAPLGVADRLLVQLGLCALHCDGFEPVSMPRLPGYAPDPSP
jgi:hypothetical protein